MHILGNLSVLSVSFIRQASFQRSALNNKIFRTAHVQDVNDKMNPCRIIIIDRNIIIPNEGTIFTDHFL